MKKQQRCGPTITFKIREADYVMPSGWIGSSLPHTLVSRFI
ncbi:hypothetical protein [Methanoregula sp. PtaU1.Bin006]|nr:hypothetical protein [Methanoregula sp. PtaU1.Bin006]